MSLATRVSFQSLALAVHCLVVGFLAQPANGTTYVMMSDEDLADQAPIIAEVDILLSFNVPREEAPQTGYTAIVTRVLKGVIDSSTIDIHVLGGIAPDGMELWVPGIPRFTAGEKALLFLHPNADGSFGVLHWLLGTFRLAESEGIRLAIRDFTDADLIANKNGPNSHLLRDYEAFSSWLMDRAGGLQNEPEYFRNVDQGVLDAKYRLITYRGKNIRWFDFDQGRSVTWRFRATGAQGSLSSFKNSLSAWNRDNATNVRYVYGGTTSARNGWRRRDRINAIIFGDPNREVSGAFSCGSGGTLAAASGWVGGTGRFQGKTFYKIEEMDIVVNDGTECFIRNNSTRARMVFAHELGHTLGIDHSTNRSALMYASGHNNGSNLHSDDLRALRSLYQGGSSQPPPADLAAPTNLTATATSSTGGRLAWKDNSSGESGFEVWIIVQNGDWKYWRTRPGNTTGFDLKDFQPGWTYQFVIRAKKGSQYSDWSNVASVTMSTEGPDPGGLQAPSSLKARSTSSTTGKLTWRDNSKGESSFDIWIRFGNREWEAWETAPANRTSKNFEGASPGATYYFRLRARKGNQYSGWSNTASVTMPTSGPAGLAAPSSMRAWATSSTRGVISWRDNSSDESQFEVWVKIVRWQKSATFDANTTSASFRDAGPGLTYRFKVRAIRGNVASAFSNVARVTMPR